MREEGWAREEERSRPGKRLNVLAEWRWQENITETPFAPVITDPTGKRRLKSPPKCLLRCLFAFLGLAGCAFGQSTWVHFDDTGHLTYYSDNLGNHLPDYSYAGYEEGGVALPSGVPVKVTLSATNGDNTTLIQNAINTVGSELTGTNLGAVLLNSGTYDMLGVLTMSKNGVVLEGSGTTGAAASVLVFTGTPSTHITISSGGISYTGSTAITDSYVPLGATSFHVASTSGLSVGSAIVVHRPWTQSWIDAIGMEDFWTPSNGSNDAERTITAISGTQITVDIPLPVPIDSQYTSGEVYVYTDSRIQQCGVQNMVMDSLQGGGTSNPTYEFGATGVLFGSCRNCWCSNMAFSGYGVAVDSNYNSGAKWCTAQDCTYSNGINNGSARPAAFQIQGEMLLFQRLNGISGFEHECQTGDHAMGPNVFLDCCATGTDFDGGPHRFWAVSLLTDNEFGDIDDVHITIITGGSNGWGAGFSTFYNCTCGTYDVECPVLPNYYNWWIGGHATNDTPDSDPGVVDASGTTVSPNSLYLEQLKERLGPAAVGNIGYSIFALTGTADVENVLAGTSAFANLNVSPIGSFANTVGFGASYLPAGATGAFTPTSVTASGTSGFVLTTSTSTPSGSYPVLVTGTAPYSVGVDGSSSKWIDSFPFTVTVNTLPDIIVVQNQSAAQSFNLGYLGGTAPASLQVTATSSNPSFVPQSGLVVSGSGTSARTLTITPAASTSGTSRITVNVSNGTTSISQGFDFTANAVYSPPTVSTVSNLITDENLAAGPVTFSSGELETTGSLTVTATSSNPSLVPNSGLVVTTETDPWTSADIGVVTVSGSTDVGQSITVEASGTDIWNTTDSGRYVYDPMTGNGQIIARVDSLQPVNAWSKAGVMMRSGTDPACPEASMFVSASNGVLFGVRPSEGALTTSVDQITGISAPIWVQLVKSGTNFTAFYAQDDGGEPGAWVQVGGTAGAAISGSFLTGLGVTSHTTGVLCKAVLDHVSGEPDYSLAINPNAGITGTTAITISVTDGTGATTESFVYAVNPSPQISTFDDRAISLGGTAGPIALTALPVASAYDPVTITGSSSDTALVPTGDIIVSSASNPWSNIDLGQPGYTGSSLPGDIFTVVGSGSDLYNTEDQGQYIYQPATGNGEITARVTSLQPVNVWSKAALMMRSGTAADASDVYVLVSASEGVSVQYRSTTGGSAAQSDNITGIAAPCWLQLVKSGTDFTGYYAEDENGVPGTWVQVGGTLGINLGADYLTGLAVTSHDYGLPCTATFDNLSGPANVGGNDSLTIYTVPNISGTATITLTVSDGLESVDSFLDIITTPSPVQSWRLQYFGTSLDSGSAADTANPAGDGVCNLVKYALGMNPDVNSIAGLPVMSVSGGHLELQFDRNLSATDVTYTVEASSDLANWTAVATLSAGSSTWTQSGATVTDNDGAVTVVDSTAVGSQSRLFLQLVVTGP